MNFYLSPGIVSFDSALVMFETKEEAMFNLIIPNDNIDLLV